MAKNKKKRQKKQMRDREKGGNGNPPNFLNSETEATDAENVEKDKWVDLEKCAIKGTGNFGQGFESLRKIMRDGNGLLTVNDQPMP